MPGVTASIECPVCRKIGAWDNRQTKTNPKAPDYRCKNAACAAAAWTQPDGQLQWKAATPVPAPTITVTAPPPPQPAAFTTPIATLPTTDPYSTLEAEYHALLERTSQRLSRLVIANPRDPLLGTITFADVQAAAATIWIQTKRAAGR